MNTEKYDVTVVKLCLKLPFHKHKNTGNVAFRLMRKKNVKTLKE